MLRSVVSNNDDSDDPDDFEDKVVFIPAFDRAHPSTSKKSFHEEENSGRLNRKRDIVTRAYQQFGPGSSGEVLTAAGLGQNLNLWRARVTDLTNEGVLKQIDKRPCRVTGKEVAILQYVEPKDRVRRVRVEPRDAAIVELCDALEGLVTENPSLFTGREDRLAEIQEMIASGRRLVGQP